MALLNQGGILAEQDEHPLALFFIAREWIGGATALLLILSFGKHA